MAKRLQSIARMSLLLLLLLLLISASVVEGSGEPRSTLVVANVRSQASMEVAAYYAVKRHIPPENVLFVDINPAIQARKEDIQKSVVTPVWERIGKLDNRITHVVLTQGIPYRVSGVSVTAVVAFGGYDKIPGLNPRFRAPSGIAAGVRYLEVPMVITTYLAGATVDDALKLIDRSAAADFSKPDGTVYLCEGTGARSVRRRQYESLKKALERAGRKAEIVKGAAITGKDDVLGYMSGAVRLPVEKNKYLPGAIVDNLTSFGGRLYEESGQMSILSCITAGASAAHGTVSEPTNQLMRWPEARMFLYYLNGFSLAETYWHSIASPFLGLVVGDPLMQPWAERPNLG